MKAIIHQIRRVSPMFLLGAIVVLTAAKSKMCVPTPTELICEADSECGGVPPVDCVGAWACVDGGCEFVCSVEPPPETCYSSNECGPGTHCSVDDGACDPMPGCGGAYDAAGMPADPIACPAVCAGQCVANQDTSCWSDYDCPSGMYCEYDATYGGGATGAAIWCPPCDDPALPCDCQAPPAGVCKAAQMEICDGIDNDYDGLVDEDGVCGNECQSDVDCPSGYVCEGMGGACPPCQSGIPCAPCFYQPGQCVPTGELECTSDADCPAGTMCSVNEGDVYCPPCAPGEYCPMYCAMPVGVCIVSNVEICDGHDNDGDGLIDEGGVCGGDFCIDDMDCPDGFVCDYTGCPPCTPGSVCPKCLVAAGQCVPASNGDCMYDAECGPGEFCSAQSTDCLPCNDPTQPCPMLCTKPIGICVSYGPEVCDGMDNDGNGMVDEGGVCGTTGQCSSDADCPASQYCGAVNVCWDQCDPNGGGCWGGCGIEYVCTTP